MEPFAWTCPYCGKATTITDPNLSRERDRIYTSRSKHGACYLWHLAIACPDRDCGELSLDVALLTEKRDEAGNLIPGDTIKRWKLLPNSPAKPQPDYIPKQIRNDYIEACLIAKDSPKASATLARRCLQGIVRDFWEIRKSNRGNLGAELSFIKDQVDQTTWDAIQAIRSVGDIGAHMEKDVNYIVDVEAEEAALLIELVETLFKDWYVDRHERKTRAEAVQNLVARKKAERKNAKASLEKSVEDGVSD